MSKYIVLIISIIALGNFLPAIPARALSDNTPISDSAHTALVTEAQQSLNPLNYTSAQQVIGVVIRVLITFIGSIAMILYVWAGVIFMTAQGNAEKVKQSLLIFLWTSLGVLVVLGSYVIIDFIFLGLKINY